MFSSVGFSGLCLLRYFGRNHTVAVIDDLMQEVRESATMTANSPVTMYSHHRNITVIFIVQKLYGDSKKRSYNIRECPYYVDIQIPTR